MNEQKYMSPKEAREYLGVSSTTLRKWEKEGKLEVIRIGPTQQHRRYRLVTETTQEKPPRKKIIYARVSSVGQKEDLERQIELLRSKYPDHRLVKDIGSGLNFKRKGLNSILEQSVRGDIEEIVVTNRDRLCRFGFEVFEKILGIYNGRIVVLYDQDCSPEQEMAEDVLSVITVLSSRLYGRRSHRNKRDKNEDMGQIEQRSGEVQDSEV